MSNVTRITQHSTAERIEELITRRDTGTVLIEVPTSTILAVDLLGFAETHGCWVHYSNGRFVLKPKQPAAKKPGLIQRGLQYITTPQAV